MWMFVVFVSIASHVLCLLFLCVILSHPLISECWAKPPRSRFSVFVTFARCRSLKIFCASTCGLAGTRLERLKSYCTPASLPFQDSGWLMLMTRVCGKLHENGEKDSKFSLVLVVILMGEVVIFTASLITSVLLIIGTKKVKKQTLLILIWIANSMILERRSLRFSVSGDFASRHRFHHYKSGSPSLAVHSVRHLQRLFFHMHFVALPANPRRKAAAKFWWLRTNADEGVKLVSIFSSFVHFQFRDNKKKSEKNFKIFSSTESKVILC